MTPKQVAKLVGKWKRILRLRDWEIRIDTRSGELVDSQDSFSATVERDSRMRIALICIATGRPPRAVEEDIVHELVHIVLHPLWSAIHRATQQLGQQARELADATVADGEELAVEALTNALIEAYAEPE